jgi:putative hydrolase of the HAD superfamily
MKKYKGILFDLDHTLWDYETNAAETLAELYHQHFGSHTAVVFQDFHRHFVRINTQLWLDYDRGLIPREVIREQRFHRVFLEVGIDDYPLSLMFSDDYVRESPKKSNLLPQAKEVLDYLQARYPMVIVTNGFEEIQTVKVDSAGLRPYFRSVVTSERAQSKKPEPGIFDLALQEIGVDTKDALMVGDNLLTDIAGARQAGIDQVFYNPAGTRHEASTTYEIRHLSELLRFL